MLPVGTWVRYLRLKTEESWYDRKRRRQLAGVRKWRAENPDSEPHTAPGYLDFLETTSTIDMCREAYHLYMTEALEREAIKYGVMYRPGPSAETMIVSPLTGIPRLGAKGVAIVRANIRTEKAALRQGVLDWVNVITPILTALTGLIGVIIGLIALTKG
jgi:hypothetical protein